MKRARLAWLGVAGFLAAPLAAQLPGRMVAGAPAVQLSGELGTFGELYNRTGAPGRRPGGTGRLYLDANATLFGSLTVGIDLLASTEDGASLGASGLPGRQSITQLGLHPQWRWGRADLGSFANSYSPFTYNAIQIRGAAIDVQPGRLRFGAFGGRAASSVFGGAVNGSYRRTVAGGHVGYGRQAPGVPASFIELTLMRAWDDPNSLPAVDTTLPPNAPTPPGGTLVNPYAVTPEENVVAAVAGGLNFLKGKVSWRGELASAVHTRDVRASELDTSQAEVPGVLRGLITPRVGTHADYAFSSDVQLRGVRLPGGTGRSPRTLTASLGFRHIGPGYTSLGVASLANDLEAVDTRVNVRFARWSAQAYAGGQHDNLVGQKLSTTTRYRLGGATSIRMSRAWMASFRASLNTMANGSADSLAWLDYHAWTFGMGHSLAFGPRRRVESLTIDYNFQNAGDGNPLRSSTGFTAHSGTARLAIRAAPTLQVVPAVGYTSSQSDTLPRLTRATYGLSAAWNLWGGRLAASGSVGNSRYSRNNSLTSTFGARLRVTPRDDLILNLQLNRYSDTAVPSRGFDEQILNLRWARRL